MKKTSIIYVLAIMAIFLPLGCTIDEHETITGTHSSSGESVVLIGGFVDTRTAFDEASGGVYELVWSEGDEIGIFSYDMLETANINSKATLYDASAGEELGIFLPEEVIDEETAESYSSLDLPETTTETFLIYYPYDSDIDLDLDDACIHHSIASSQTQDAVSDKGIGQNGFSWAMTTVSPDDQEVNFTLQHTMGYLRFVVTTTEYADWQLHALQLYDKNEEARLVGDFIFDPEEGEVSLDESGSFYSSATVTVENDDFTLAGGEQELYLTVLPGDFSSSDFIAVVSYINSDGTIASIPMDIDETMVVSGATMYTINIDDVGSETIAYDWYEPNEARELVGGWCYGPQNTYFIEQKEAGGGTTSLTIDVKARGDISMVREPKYYGWISPSDYTSVLLMQFPDGNSSTSTLYELDSDYTVTVECLDQGEGGGYWGHLAIYDEDGNILWSFMIWKYLTQDPPTTMEYEAVDRVLLDRQIGSPYSNTYRWEQAVTVQNVQAETAYFQWGRPSPFPKQTGYYSQKYVTYDVDLQYALEHPNISYSLSSGTLDDGTSWNSNGDWKVGNNSDALWGADLGDGSNYDSSIVGVKTIYDPCPEGYRVCDPAILAEVTDNSTMLEASQTSHHTSAGYPVSGSTDSPLNASFLVYEANDEVTDYWLFGGFCHGSSSSYTNRTSTSLYSGYGYWGNSTTTEGRGCIMYGYYSSTGWQSGKTYNRVLRASVRCQVDEYGR